MAFALLGIALTAMTAPALAQSALPSVGAFVRGEGQISQAGPDLLATQPRLGVAFMLCAAAALTMLVRREAPKTTPLVPLDLLRVWSVSLSAAASVCLFTGQTAALVAAPFYLQHSLGLSPMRTALYIRPWPFAVVIVAPLAGHLADRVSTV